MCHFIDYVNIFEKLIVDILGRSQILIHLETCSIYIFFEKTLQHLCTICDAVQYQQATVVTCCQKFSVNALLLINNHYLM